MQFRRIGSWMVMVGVAALIGTTAATGCVEDGRYDSVDATQFPAAYAQALCTSLRHCCDENSVALPWEACTSGWRSILAKRLADPILSANYDAKVALDCLKRVREGASVDCSPVSGSISDARSVCQQIFLGKKPVGASCNTSAECAPVPDARVVCDGSPNPDPDAGLLPLSNSVRLDGIHPLAGPPGPPKCIALPKPQPGDRCTTTALAAVCESEPTLFCDRSDGVCKALGQAGSACKSGANGCFVGLFCSANVCSPKVGIGQKCASNDECANRLRCDTSSGVCALGKDPGQSCATSSDCSIGVCDPGTKRCLKNAIATTDTCGGRDLAP
jgi:hypothetical protein